MNRMNKWHSWFRLSPERRKGLLTLGIYTIAGAFVGGGIHYGTDLATLLPASVPRVFVGSDCAASEVAVSRLEGSQVVLVPTAVGELDTRACDHTMRLLQDRGAVWLQLFDAEWLCGRFSQWGHTWVLESQGRQAVPVISRRTEDGWNHQLGITDWVLDELADADEPNFSQDEAAATDHSEAEKYKLGS